MNKHSNHTKDVFVPNDRSEVEMHYKKTYTTFNLEMQKVKQNVYEVIDQL